MRGKSERRQTAGRAYLTEGNKGNEGKTDSNVSPS